jgi:hypothetical protein
MINPGNNLCQQYHLEKVSECISTLGIRKSTGVIPAVPRKKNTPPPFFYDQAMFRKFIPLFLLESISKLKKFFLEYDSNLPFFLHSTREC